MLLVGRDASLFTRQVAIWCALQGRSIDRLPLSTSADAEALQAYHPAGRVPVLVLEDGTHLIETDAICDWLDETSHGRRLVPERGLARRDCLQRMACMKMAGDKLVALFGALRRAQGGPGDASFIARLRAQYRTGFAMLEERVAPAPFLGGADPDGSDIAMVCAWQMVELMAEPGLDEAHPKLAGVVERALELPAFSDTNPLRVPT